MSRLADVAVLGKTFSRTSCLLRTFSYSFSFCTGIAGGFYLFICYIVFFSFFSFLESFLIENN